MISSSLKRWQQSNNYRIDGDTVYGVYKGASNVGFSVAEEDGGKLFIFMLSGPDRAFDAIEDSFLDQRGDLHEIQVGDVESYLALFFDESAGEMSDYSMDDLLDFVAGKASAFGFRVPNVCVKCGAPANKRSFVDGMVQPLCAECSNAQKNGGRTPAPAPQQERPRDRGDRGGDYGEAPLRPQRPTYDESYDEYEGFSHKQSPLSTSRGYDDYDDHGRSRVPQEGENSSKGGLGAFLGALAGLVPYLGTALIPFELAALCFLSGFGAVFGYIAFSGERDSKKGLTSSIVISELVSIVSVLLVSVFSHAQNGIGAAFSQTFSSLPWLNLIMAILGAALGAALLKDKLDKYSRQ